MNSMDRYIKRMFNMFANFSAVNMLHIKIKKKMRPLKNYSGLKAV